MAPIDLELGGMRRQLAMRLPRDFLDHRGELTPSRAGVSPHDSTSYRALSMDMSSTVTAM
jgi:hypothetical protein